MFDEARVNASKTSAPSDLSFLGSTPPEQLAAENVWLEQALRRPWLSRQWAYMRHGGPGYLQSALTMGGGTASSCLIAGAAFGFDLLWVPALGMVLGGIVFAAIAHQTLSTGMRPFTAMRRFAGPVFAWGWAIGTIVASVVWHLAQYSLASAVLVDLAAVAGWEVPRFGMGLLVLAWAIPMALGFGSGAKWRGAFERAMRWMVWSIVGLFALVFVRVGLGHGGEIVDGFLSFRIPDDRDGVPALGVIIAGLAAAVGINMTFLYPYTLLARGWGRSHRELARTDIAFGMVLPYIIVTTLMTVVAAITLSATFTGKSIGPVEAAQSLGAMVGPIWGRVLFDLGILAMVSSTIVLHMVCCGVAVSEMANRPFGGRAFRWGAMIPAPAVVGSLYWSDLSIWLAVPTGVVTGFLLPLVYVAFLKLQCSGAYLGRDRPTGGKLVAWAGALALATIVLGTFLAWYAMTKGPDYLSHLRTLFEGSS
ncbi:MAG: divalent metal cation transporter [Planctomycetota bacterium]|nr:divalent metal cation transporter [Planctomycetota bacterium]MDA1106522.1 divalent metal cation transporter [Planctomycetota bacterium]